MSDIEEILSLKALFLTGLSKLESMEKKALKPVSKSKLKKISGTDVQYQRRRKQILRSQNKS